MQGKEHGHFERTWIITRYPDVEHYRRREPAPVPDINGPIGAMLPAQSIIHGNVLLNAGITAALNILTGAGANTIWDNANAYIGVGDNNTAAANNQSGLLAPTNKAWGNMSATYPQVSSQTATWQAAFDANTANFGWQEFTIVNAANDTGDNLNRLANNQGTKVAGQVWTVQVQLTLS